MITLPNPFNDSAGVVMLPADTAAALNASPGVAAAGPNSNPVAKATKGKTGTAGINDPVRRSTTGTGLRVGEADAVRPATSEIMDVTAGETALISGGLWDEYDRDQKLRALYDVLDPPQPPLFLRTGRITDYQPDPSLKHILKVFFAMEA